jgi:hypothetical protein
MSGRDRSIFRTEAVRRHIEGQEDSVLPRFVSPRAFLWLWILLGLLIVGGCFVIGLARHSVLAGPAAYKLQPLVAGDFAGQ